MQRNINELNSRGNDQALSTNEHMARVMVKGVVNLLLKGNQAQL